MKIQQIRNATTRIDYGGVRFLIDPYLAEKESQPGFPGTVNNELRNPRVALPVPVEALLDVDAVIVTHTHEDHWDEAARNLLPKTLPIFVQNGSDRDLISGAGFADVRVLDQKTTFNGVSLIKTPGQHGSDADYEKIGDILGDVCGVVFRHPDEKILYLAGDTIWNQYVEDNLKTYTPDIVIVNSGDARALVTGPIIMDKQDVVQVCRAAPKAKVVTSHMEAINHCTLSRAELRAFLKEKGLIEQVHVAEDGEVIEF